MARIGTTAHRLRRSKIVNRKSSNPAKRPRKASPPRPRGAPPGNTNALKHGLYSTLVSVRDDVELVPMPRDHSDPELAFARVRLKNLVLKQRSAPPEHWLGYEKAIQHYIDRIASITHKNAVLGRDHGAAFVTVMEMIRQANNDQNVS